MLTIPAGPQLIALVQLAYTANVPLLLHGRHGIGKSELLQQAAESLGIEQCVRDLSIMESPDLSGMPRIDERGRTTFAPPGFLPDSGCGLLVFEELNRTPRHVLAPCLQLLTARRLNEYALPAGWLPCAAVNDAADGYDTQELDPALLSRFLNVIVTPDVTAWLSWAQEHGVHDKICAFVAESPDVFEDPQANPRAWVYASKLLQQWERTSCDEALLPIGLAGLLGEKWALAFLQIYRGRTRPLQPDELLDHYPAHRAVVQQWLGECQLDVIAASVELLKRHLQPQRVYDAVIAGHESKANLELFLQDIPADLAQEMRAWCEERGFMELAGQQRQKRRGRP